ncbi:hypothetical protein AB0I60_21425 [Actinosynnema sp. NPDC050436]|uniref:hypothetical protein n=1 Tax=Actinosynnema sp. NPDC050436 TaxID=3155659 RepID=UPI0033C20280
MICRKWSSPALATALLATALLATAPVGTASADTRPVGVASSSAGPAAFGAAPGREAATGAGPAGPAASGAAAGQAATGGAVRVGLAAHTASGRGAVPGAVSVRGAVPPPSPEDFAAALDAARAPSAISFAKTNFRQVHGTEPATVTVADHGVAAYVLNPDFVRGVPDAPAGVLQYIAVTATADDGKRATLRADPQGAGGWTVGSVFSGDDEETLGRRLPDGSVLLNEPQINGWYELTPTGVVLLQASLPQTPVGAFVPIADYQAQVRARYGDKLPGSDYEKDQGIGFPQQDAAPPAAPAPPGSAWPGWAIAGAAALVVLAFALVVRRRYSQRKSTPASEESSPSK